MGASPPWDGGDCRPKTSNWKKGKTHKKNTVSNLGSFFFEFTRKFLFLVLFEPKHVPMSKSAINIGQSGWKIRCGEEHLQQLT
jgi:hypothetical protein